MPIPTFDRMLRPILEIASTAPTSRRAATEGMASHFGLTAEEQSALIPSGSATVLANRAGWAMTFLTKGGLIEKVAPRQYRATARGLEFLREHPKTLTVRDLKAIEGWEQAWTSGKKKPAQAADDLIEQIETPLESIDRAVIALHAELRSRLLRAILDQSPAFFEQLVLDVLLAMGYGGSRAEAAEHLGKSGDEGIDGRINQDRLGLDQILVQAKRNRPDNVIDRKTIQQFFGSLAGQGVTKGIFITTSSFAASATEFVKRGSNTKIVLIDGEALIDLMMRYQIGVRKERVVDILALDQNYFTDET